MEQSPAKRRKRNTSLPPSPAAAAASAFSGVSIQAAIAAPAVHIGPSAVVAVAASSSSPFAPRSNARKRRAPRQAAQSARAGGGASGDSDADGAADSAASAAYDEDEEAEEEQRLRDEEMYDDDDDDDGDDDTESDGGPAARTVVSATSAKSLSVRCVTFPKGCAERTLYTPLDAHIFFHASSEFEHCARAALGLDPSYSLPERMTRAEWNVIRRAMGPVRRLGPAFLHQQRQWLQHERAVLRTKQREAHAAEQSNSNMRATDAATAPLLNSLNSSVDAHSEPTPPVLPAGTAVFALHPTEIGLAPAIVLDAVEVQGSSDAFRNTQRRRRSSVQLAASDSTSSPAAAAAAAVTKSPASLNTAAAAAALSCSSSKSSSTGAAAAVSQLIYRVRFDHAPLAAPAFATDSQLFLRPHHPANRGVLNDSHPDLLDPAAREGAVAQHLRAELIGEWGALPAAAAAAPTTVSAVHTPFMHGPTDVRLLCELLQLVDRKKLLVEQLALMNEAAEIMRAHPVAADDATAAAPPAAAAPTLQQANSTQLPMQIDGDNSTIPALEGAAGAAAAAAAAPVAAEPSSSSRVAPPDPNLTPLQFASAYDQFGRQYAWVVLQLESTSRALDATLQQLRVRRAAARRREAARVSALSSFALDGGKHEAGAAASLHHDASRLVQTAVREMMASGALARSSALAARDSDVQRLVSHAITLVLMLQRVMEGEASAAWLEAAVPPVLAALTPRHAAHAGLHAEIAGCMGSLQRLLRAAPSAPPAQASSSH